MQTFASSRATNSLEPLPIPKSLLGLGIRALQCIGKRIAFYASMTLVALLLQLAIALLWRVPQALPFAIYVVGPVLTTIVYAFVAADARDSDAPAEPIWPRILERAWAVIVIDLGLGLLQQNIMGGPATLGVGGVLEGVLLLFMTTSLIFADASATVDDGDSALLLIPRSLGRSIAVVFAGGLFQRGLIVLAVQLVAAFAVLFAYAAASAHHLKHGDLWTLLVFNTILGVPIAAFTMLVYLEKRVKAV